MQQVCAAQARIAKQKRKILHVEELHFKEKNETKILYTLTLYQYY